MTFVVKTCILTQRNYECAGDVVMWRPSQVAALAPPIHTKHTDSLYCVSGRAT